MVLGIFQFAMRQTSSIAMVVHLLARDGSLTGLSRVAAIGQYSIISIISINRLKKYFIFLLVNYVPSMVAGSPTLSGKHLKSCW